MITAPPRPGLRWPAVRNSADPWMFFLELCRTERLSETAVEVGQRRQLAELLEHATANTPYYERVFREARVDKNTPLRALPILTRQQLREHFSEMTPRRLPAMTLLGATQTSGTTGEPVTVNWTSVQQRMQTAQLLRYLTWAGFRQKHKLASIRYIDPSVPLELGHGNMVPVWDPALIGLVETGPAYFLSINEDPLRQYQWLCGVEPTYLVTYPTNLMHLTEIARKNGRIPRLKRVVTLSEPLTEDMREEIEAELEVEIYDVYSCKELGCIASQCECGYYHVHAENVIVEVLDDDGELCEHGQEGRVVLTGLHTFATPLIRYEIGDRARVPNLTVECERVKGLPSLIDIEGRAIPAFLMPDGTRKNSMQIAAMMRKLADGQVLQFSVTQTAPMAVNVQAVPSDTLDLVGFSQGVTKGIHEFFGSDQVQVTLDYELLRLPLNEAGKAPPTLATRV